jgi:hypothetical protein
MYGMVAICAECHEIQIGISAPLAAPFAVMHMQVSAAAAALAAKAVSSKHFATPQFVFFRVKPNALALWGTRHRLSLGK